MAAVVIALLAALVVWLVVGGGGGGGGGKPGRGSGAGPAPANSITPGPSGSGPAISGEPGGRDTSGGSDGGTGSAGAGTGGGSGGAGGTSGGGAGSGGAGDEGGSGTGGGGTVAAGGSSGGAAGSGGVVGGGAVAARALPADSPMATCAPGRLKLSLDSAKVAYAPGQTPQFKLVVTNGSGAECKANLGPTSVVLTITDSDDDQVWTSKDCPRTATQYFDVPAHTTVVRTVSWDRRHSTTKCSGPAPAKAGDGTYLAEVKTSVASVSQAQASIRLTKD